MHGGSPHLPIEVAGGQHRNRGESVRHLGEVRLLALPPGREVGPLDLLGENPVDHDRIGPVAVEGEQSEGPPRLVDHHPVRVHDEPDRGPLPVLENCVHLDELLDDLLDLLDHLGVGKGDVEGSGQRGGGAEQVPVPGKDFLHPPFGDLGESEQLDRLGRRGAVDHQHIEFLFLPVATDF